MMGASRLSEMYVSKLGSDKGGIVKSLISIAVLTLLATTGCSDDDDTGLPPAATSTPTEVAVATSTPVATATEHASATATPDDIGP